MIEFFVPGKLVNPLNGSFSRSHWSRRSRWANEWKARTIAALCAAHPNGDDSVPLHAPKRVTFLAQTGAAWDDDAIPAGLKPVRDALIGYVIHSDAPDSGHEFRYSQVICRQHRGVLIRVEPRP